MATKRQDSKAYQAEAKLKDEMISALQSEISSSEPTRL
jgi:hypothetical protein